MSDKVRMIYFAEYRARLDNPDQLVIHAGTNETYMEHAKIKAYIDGENVPVKAILRDNTRSRFCYKWDNLMFSCEYQFVLDVPKEFRKAKVVVTFAWQDEVYIQKYTVSGRSFRKAGYTISGAVDSVLEKDSHINVTGWCAYKDPVNISVLKDGKPADCVIERVSRSDISDYYQDDELIEDPGFKIIFPLGSDYETDIVFTSGNEKVVHHVDLSKRTDSTDKSFGRLASIAMSYMKQRGILETAKKVLRKISRDKKSMDYDKWIKQKEPKKTVLMMQRNHRFPVNPKFSIVVPVYRPDEKYFAQMLKSVMDQTYTDWELCLADGSGSGHEMRETVLKVCKGDSRVKYVALKDNLGISGNTNAALDMSTGDYIVLGDHDDIIRPNALFECASAINEDNTIDVIYSDEDKYDCGTRKRFMPHFKPDFSPDMLNNNNYICHLFVFSRELYEKVGGFNSDYDGSQDYDLILRCTEKAANIKHIPKVLYTWRCHMNSTAMNPESKKYAYDAGIRAAQAHFDRLGIKAHVSEGYRPGYNRVRYDIEGNPKVSILIPNKDHVDDLKQCLESIIGIQDYTNYEIIVIENNSTEQSTFDYYKKIESAYDCVKVIYYDGDFNYSKINNYGAAVASGEYLLLLNNDTEMINKDCLRELVSFGTRPEVGIVGARLLYEDGTVQHAGVIIGLGGVAGHAFAGIKGDDPGYFARAVIPQNYSAVTAACMLVRRSVYDEVGGLDELFKVAFNDVDFCLRVRQKGYLIVYNPEAKLYHYESKSRGVEDTPEKAARFMGETNNMMERWAKVMEAGDPYYNPNLSLKRSDFSIRV